MAKSSRKKKEKAKDFAKPKLRVGKQLANAANVTDTAFKSSAVFVPIQLAKAADSVTSMRGVTLKGLIRKLQHVNVNTRASALADIVEMLKGHPDMAAVELFTITNGAGPSAFDSEKRVRIEFGRLLKLILKVVSKARLQAQMSSVCAFLSCALTHPNESIARDGFQFADEVLSSQMSDLLVRQQTQLLNRMLCHIRKQLLVGSSNRAEKRDSSDQAVLRHQQHLLRIVSKLLNVLAPADFSSLSRITSDSSDCPVVHASGAAHNIAFLRVALPGAWRLPRDNGQSITGSTVIVNSILEHFEPLLTEICPEAIMSL